MSDKTKKEVYENDYMALFDDGSMGLSDGVGYLDTLDKEKVFELYMALKKFVESNKALFEEKEMKPEPLDGKISKEMIKKEIDITNMKCGVDGCDEVVSAGMFICGKDIFDGNGGRFFINDGEFETLWECEKHGMVSAKDGNTKYAKPSDLMNMKIVCIDDRFFINLNLIKSACDFFLLNLKTIENDTKFRISNEREGGVIAFSSNLINEVKNAFKLAFKDVFREAENDE